MGCLAGDLVSLCILWNLLGKQYWSAIFGNLRNKIGRELLCSLRVLYTWSLLPSAGRCPAVPHKARLQHMWHLPGKANIRTMNALFHAPFSELLLLNMMSYGIEHPFFQFGSAVLAVLLPSLLSIPSLPTGWGGRMGKKKILILC